MPKSGQEVVTVVVGNVAVIPCPVIPASKPPAIVEFQFNGAMLPAMSCKSFYIMFYWRGNGLGLGSSI